MITRLNLFLRFACCAAVTWMLWEICARIGYPALGLVIAAPLWGVFFCKPLVEIFPAIARSANRTAMQPWEGKYYRYEETHLRMYFAGDDAWFVADDILAAVGKKRERWMEARFEPGEYQVIPGRSEMGFTPEAVLKFLDMSELPEARKFRLWFERAVVFTLQRKQAMRDASGSA